MKKRPGSLSSRIARLEESLGNRGALFILTQYENDDPEVFQREVEKAKANAANTVIVVKVFGERPRTEPAPKRRAVTAGVR